MVSNQQIKNLKWRENKKKDIKMAKDNLISF